MKIDTSLTAARENLKNGDDSLRRSKMFLSKFLGMKSSYIDDAKEYYKHAIQLFNINKDYRTAGEVCLKIYELDYENYYLFQAFDNFKSVDYEKAVEVGELYISSCVGEKHCINIVTPLAELHRVNKNINDAIDVLERGLNINYFGIKKHDIKILIKLYLERKNYKRASELYYLLDKEFIVNKIDYIKALICELCDGKEINITNNTLSYEHRLFLSNILRDVENGVFYSKEVDTSIILILDNEVRGLLDELREVKLKGDELC